MHHDHRHPVRESSRFKLAGYALWPFGRVVVQRTDRTAAVSCLGNVIWFVLAGLWLAIGHVLTGLLLCLTIIGIPFGVASFKLAGLALVPFGKQVVTAGAPLPPREPGLPGARERAQTWQDTPVACSGQYPPGFFARYCWWYGSA